MVERRVERYRLLAITQQALDFTYVFAKQMRDVLERCIALAGGRVRLQMTHRAKHDIHLLHDTRRQANRARLAHHRTFDRLPNPPGCIRRKTEPALEIEFFECVDQAQIAFFDEIRQCEPAMQIVSRNAHHETQIALDQCLARREIARTHCARQRELLRRREQRARADVVQIKLGQIDDEVRRQCWGGHAERQFERDCVVMLGVIAHGCGVIAHRDFDSRRRFHAGGRYRTGSIGFPSRRISKCSFTCSASVFPISAIFCPFATC